MTATLLANARVLWRSDVPRDVLIRDGRIAGIAPAGSSALHDAARGAERIDIDGRTLGPGLWDHHIHMNQWALARRRVDVAPAESAAHAASIVRAHLDAHPQAPGTILVGYGFRDGLWPDALTPETLRIGDVAVALVSGDLHAAWINSAAARLLGLADGCGGVLLEAEAIELAAQLDEVPPEVLDEWAMDAAEAAAQRGVVGVVDLDLDDAPAQWQRRSAARRIPLRIQAGIYPEQLDRARARGHRTGRALDGEDGMITVGPLKIITDGSLNTRTALCSAPYPGRSGAESHGVSRYSATELVDLLCEGEAAGLVAAIHAIGDRANTVALDAFEAVGTRGTIEHAQLVAPTDLPRFASLGITASVQPEHAVDDRDIADKHWEGRTDRAFAFRSLRDAGARIVLGSDAPVAPLDPWTTIAAAVYRTRDDREPWHPEQRIGIDDALRASANGASVAVGDVADIIITDLHPRDCDSSALRSMPVSGTLRAGERTHWAL